MRYSDTGPATHRARPVPRLRGVEVNIGQLIDLRLNATSLDLRVARGRGMALAGRHFSQFRGRGMEYVESRTYLPGDDIRNMDWRVTARTGRPHTKLFQEERERPIILVVDYSPSMFFGTRVAFKSVVAAHAAGVIAWAATQRGDRIGGLICSDRGHAELKPARGRRGVLRVLRALASLASTSTPAGSATRAMLGEALLKARRVTRPGSLVIVFSDFYGLDTDAERHMSRLCQHNDLVACWIYDALEVIPPPPGRYAISDGRASIILDTASSPLRVAYEQHFQSRRVHLETVCGRLGIRLVALPTEADVEETLRQGLGAPGRHRPLPKPA